MKKSALTRSTFDSFQLKQIKTIPKLMII
jgi:hypothetical protein